VKTKDRTGGAKEKLIAEMDKSRKSQCSNAISPKRWQSQSQMAGLRPTASSTLADTCKTRQALSGLSNPRR